MLAGVEHRKGAGDLRAVRRAAGKGSKEIRHPSSLMRGVRYWQYRVSGRVGGRGKVTDRAARALSPFSTEKLLVWWRGMAIAFLLRLPGHLGFFLP